MTRWLHRLAAVVIACAAAVVVGAVFFLARLVDNGTISNDRQSTAFAAQVRSFTDQISQLKAEQEAEAQLTMRLQAALDGSRLDTDRLLLALINDNRRIHGCSTITDVAQLGALPTCTIKPPPPAPPAPSTTVPPPAAQPKVAAPTTAPTTTTTTRQSCLLGVVCVPGAETSTGAPGFGCGPALAYLAAHAAPGFSLECAPHSAHGAYGMTCVNHPPQCSAGSKVIMIACPMSFVYQNEASNSLVLTGAKGGPIDPYGQGSAAQDGVCNRYV